MQLFDKELRKTRDKGTENVSEEIIAENFAHLGKEMRYPDQGGTEIS